MTGSGPAAVVAVLAAAAAAWVCWPPRSRMAAGPRSTVEPGLAAVAAVTAGLGLAVPPRWWAPTVIALAAAGLAVLLARAARARRRREENGGRVLEVCEQLAGELAVGLPPGAALDRASESWRPLRPVAESFRMGAEVPAALREVARTTPGAGELRLLAAAWQVSHRTGQGLAAATARVADDLRADHATRRVVAGELASARATARLMAGLPVLALLLGTGMGGEPWGFLLGTPLGWGCLAGGLALAGAGTWWIERLAGTVQEAT